MAAGLTQRQHDALRFIERYIAEHDGVAPTYFEIALSLGLKSKSGVYRIVCGLDERGHIRLDRRANGNSRYRSISLPTVYGASCPHCGQPIGSAQCREIATYETTERKRARKSTPERASA